MFFPDRVQQSLENVMATILYLFIFLMIIHFHFQSLSFPGYNDCWLASIHGWADVQSKEVQHKDFTCNLVLCNLQFMSASTEDLTRQVSQPWVCYHLEDLHSSSSDFLISYSGNSSVNKLRPETRTLWGLLSYSGWIPIDSLFNVHKLSTVWK